MAFSIIALILAIANYAICASVKTKPSKCVSYHFEGFVIYKGEYTAVLYVKTGAKYKACKLTFPSVEKARDYALALK